MSALVVCYEQQKELNDITNAIDQSNEWNLHYYDASEENLLKLEKKIIENEAYFLICSKLFSADIAQGLHQINERNPLLTIIYFYSVLKEREYVELHRAGIKYCFVGETRKTNLQTALKKLSAHHWKKIPQRIYSIRYDDLQPRAKKILRFIENTPVKFCNTAKLADYLKISQSHFRKEFKKYFKISFREFKQRLFTHYENILLFEKKYKPRHIYSALDYNNLSAFSRSFKSRHGKSWQAMIRSHQ